MHLAHRLASQLEGELARRLEDVADVSVHVEPPEGHEAGKLA
jgi:divalent metal cation (Fe/Co/Zn/Cd) transporter